MKGTMIIDGRKVEFENEQNVLEVVRKAGIDLPTFCYHSELSMYGACRMCIVEDNKGGIFASCSTLPKDGMEIYTNTPRIKKYRENILELLLANHDRDCTTCVKTGNCKLQELSSRLCMDDVRFPNSMKEHDIDNSSLAIKINPNKCILCGDCVRMCEEVQGVGALTFAYRGSKMKITPAFNRTISEVNCVDCGQCRAICPTGAITIKNQNDYFWELVNDKTKRVVAQIAPAVRVALGENFGLAPGTVTIGKIITALKYMGVESVFDTSFGADLTVMAESEEFLERLEKNENLPLFTSCCPAWVKYADNNFPDLKYNISSCKSPQQMFGSVLKKYYKELDKEDGKETVVISVMPCTAKKAEASKEEFITDGVRDVDLVITTQELAMLIKDAGLMFENLYDDSFDMPFGLSSGAGVIFGSSGGVAEAVLTRLMKQKPSVSDKEIIFNNVRGMEKVKEANFVLDGKEVKIAVVHGLKNASELVKQIQNGEKTYDIVEVMACPGGCIAGGGQPTPMDEDKRKKRASGLYSLNRTAQIKSSEENPLIRDLFQGLLKDDHEILHVQKNHK